MTENPTPPPPETGHPQIDAALASVELGDDVHTHAEQITAALDVIQQALTEGRRER